MPVNELLLRLGCKPNNIGYKYITDILKKGLNGEKLEPMAQYCYKELGEKYGKSVNCIEKNIQNCISNACINGDRTLLYELFGETISENKGKPTNKHFIYVILEKITAY